MRQQSVNMVVKLALFGAAVVAMAAPASADYSASVIVSGLNSPRGLDFAPDGSLYIAEGGFLTPTGPEVTGGNGAVSRFGETGSITRYQGGVTERVVTGLPSLVGVASGETAGPQDIAFGADGTGYVVIGLGTDPNARTGALASAPGAANLGHVFTFTGGTPTSFADVSAYEAANNPAGGPIDSNPFHAVASGTGLLVTDAGSNTLLNVAADGTTSLVATFPGRDIGGGFPSDSVPTGIAVGPDGAYYVAELTGFPFTPGAAQIYRVAPGEAPSVFLSGFTDIADIAFGADGSLYVLEIAANGLLDRSVGGALIRVGADGQRETILGGGLVAPTGLAVGPDGALYVTNYGTAAGGGQVLRVTAVPEPASWAMMIGGFGLVGAALRRRAGGLPAEVPARLG